jgi:glucose/mannose-6-phosphate isomerase
MGNVDLMLQQTMDQESLYLDGIRKGKSIEPRVRGALKVVFYGLGCSVIVGLLAEYMFSDFAEIPLLSYRGASLPKWVWRDSFLVLVSYSGNTLEVIECAKKSVERGVATCVVCSGGRLERLAIEKNLPMVKVRGGLTPRMAVPEMLGAVCSLLEASNAVRNATKLLENALPALRETNAYYSPRSDPPTNTAKVAAIHLHSHLPVVVCSSPLYPVALRLKNQLNENAKTPCIVVEAPEAMHNTLEALPFTSQDRYLSLRWAGEDLGLAFQMDYLKNLLSDITLEQRFGGSIIEASLSALAWSDYTSIYLAALRKVDPVPVQNISRFRGELDKLMK